MPAFAHPAPLGQRYRRSHSRLRWRASASEDSNVLSRASRVGVGTWAWGNRLLFGYDPAQDSALQAAFNAAVVRGVNLFDSGDSYGTGDLNARAEVLLGRFLRECPVSTDDVVIATKFASYPWRLTRSSICDAAGRCAERFGRPIALGQMHWSASTYAPWQERALWDGLADALEKGHCEAIGVSNVGPRHLHRVSQYLLNERGVRLASVQTQLSLLSRKPLQTGLLERARDGGMLVIGYSPLCLGLLAGGPKRSRGLVRDLLFNRLLKGAEPLQAELGEVAVELGCTQAQVAIAWSLSKGVIVLTGVRSESQAMQCAEALDVRPSAEQIRRLEDASDECASQMIENAFQTA